MTRDELRVDATQTIEREARGNGEGPFGVLARLDSRASWRLALLIAGDMFGWIACAIPWATARILMHDGQTTLIASVSNPMLSALGLIGALASRWRLAQRRYPAMSPSRPKASSVREKM